MYVSLWRRVVACLAAFTHCPQPASFSSVHLHHHHLEDSKQHERVLVQYYGSVAFSSCTQPITTSPDARLVRMRVSGVRCHPHQCIFAAISYKQDSKQHERVQYYGSVAFSS